MIPYPDTRDQTDPSRCQSMPQVNMESLPSALISCQDPVSEPSKTTESANGSAERPSALTNNKTLSIFAPTGLLTNSSKRPELLLRSLPFKIMPTEELWKSHLTTREEMSPPPPIRTGFTEEENTSDQIPCTQMPDMLPSPRLRSTRLRKDTRLGKRSENPNQDTTNHTSTSTITISRVFQISKRSHSIHEKEEKK